MDSQRKPFGIFVFPPFQLVSILTIVFYFFTFMAPIHSYAASIENLDEMTARRARYSTNPWPTTILEDANNNYIWQPETLSYTDVTTGSEVWILIHAPDKDDIYSREHGTNAWSYDGSRIGFFSINRPTKRSGIVGDYHYRWVVKSDGSGLKVCEGYGRREVPFDGFGWAHTENVYYSSGSGVGDGTGSASYKLYKNTPDSSNVIRG